MANLTRYKQKIFANNSDQVGVFGTGVEKVTSKNVETLQSAEYEGGWSEAIITNKNYPIWQEMDGVQYGFSYQLAYLLQKGMPQWLSTETYYTNDYCRVGSTIYYSLQDNNINHNPAANDGYWTPLLTNNRSIGEIIPAILPLTDAGLHLLDGALIQGTGIYAEFVTYIANLTATAPQCFTTEANWQTSVTTYGVCGKFVYDSVNNTVRLPKVTGFVEGTIDSSALGDLVQAGLPSITHTHSGTTDSDGSHRHSISSTFSLTDYIGGGSDTRDYVRPKAGNTTTYTTYNGTHTHTFTTGNNSNVNSIYGRNSTVQPQAIKGYLYIVIATSTKTDIEVDIDEIATDLNGKMDNDLSNITSTGQKVIDGQWVNSTYSIISSSTTITAATTKEYSLSSYLPNDGYSYEVVVTADGNTGSTSGNAAEIGIGSYYVEASTNRVEHSMTRASNYVSWGWSGIIPIGTDRKIYIRQIANFDCTCIYFRCKAYRRIGTNS